VYTEAIAITYYRALFGVQIEMQLAVFLYVLEVPWSTLVEIIIGSEVMRTSWLGLNVILTPENLNRQNATQEMIRFC